MYFNNPAKFVQPVILYIHGLLFTVANLCEGINSAPLSAMLKTYCKLLKTDLYAQARPSVSQFTD